MVQESVQPLANDEQLDLMQQLGRVGYWEYDPARHSFMLPPPSLQLLASMLGTSPHTAPLLRELMSDAERHRFRNALEQAVSRRLNLNLELQLTNLHGDHGTILVKGRPIERDGVLRFAGIFRDITAEKAVEAEREAVLSQLHALVGGLPANHPFVLVPHVSTRGRISI